MSTSLFSLESEIAVVIGATGVLGGALAEGLAAAGAKVAVLGRQCGTRGGPSEDDSRCGYAAAYFGADAMDPLSLKEAHAAVTSALGAPTILVNAAGWK
jgi:NAD(P)-dependent dehydrogenase (short-subunit alcohol dehydrogenase family)